MKIVSVNVGAPRELVIKGRRKSTGIFKEAVGGRVRIAGVAVGSDVQMDKKHHGGPFKAAYVYAIEDYEWWSRELDRGLAPGTFGDNVTTSGLDVTNALIGERWRVGSALLEVTDPRIPCSTLSTRMGIRGFVKRFAAAKRFGAYTRIVEEGDVAAGDPLEVEYRPEHGVTIVDVARVHYSGDQEEAEEIYRATGFPEHYADWVKA
jgi:MOSC domain-containing protein YiiM